VALAILGEHALPALQSLLASSDPLDQALAAQALVYMGPRGRAAASGLARLLESPNALVAKWALEALGEIGVPARATREAVQRCAERHPGLRRRVRDVLWRLEWLHDPDRPHLTLWWNRITSS
jgi:hypothetical protein